MANLAGILAAVAPNGFWENIIFNFNNVIGNYAVAVILLTICIKLVMLPIDYFNKRSSSKMQEVQTKLAPKMAEIKKRYPDPQVQNQKTQELYQKEGFNPMGSCLTMLVVMVLSIAVFFTLFGSLNNMAAYKIADQYEQLERAYVQEYVVENVDGVTNENYDEFEIDDENMAIYINAVANYDVTIDAEFTNRANEAVKAKYAKVKESFLWIKNVWIADSPMSKEIPDFETYASIARLSFEDDTAKEQAKTNYNAVMGQLMANAGVNGYFVLAVLTGVTAFLYQYLQTKKKKQKENFYTKNAPQNQQPGQGKAMLIVMPVLMVIFTLSYNSVFALYIIASQLVGMAAAPLINKLIDLKSEKTTK